MTTREQFLRDKTHKDDGVEVDRRVFYTLNDDNGPQSHRNTAIALVIKRPNEKGISPDVDVDELLGERVARAVLLAQWLSSH